MPVPEPGRTEANSRTIQAYLNAVAQLKVVSVILFGSAAQGSFTTATSDVDLILVLADGASGENRRQVRDEVLALEIAHNLRALPGRPNNLLQNFAARAAGYDMSSFICTRADLLSGDVARIFGLSPAEAVFVDRILPASVIISAGTVCGEELLPHVRLLPVRRFDVFKSLFTFLSSIVMSAAAFLLLPDATKQQWECSSIRSTVAISAIT